MEIPNRNHHVEQLDEKIWRIDEFGLNCMYLIEGSEKALVIDVGTGVGDFKGVVEQLTALPYDVVATHCHTDHVGGRGQFDAMYIHPAAFEEVAGITPEKRKNFVGKMLAGRTAETFPFQLDDIKEVEREPVLIPIAEGDTIDLGDRKLEVIENPGHTTSCISLFDPKSRILFSGDAFNPVMLLLMAGEDRKEVMKLWLKGAEKVYAMREKFIYMCGGHAGPLPLEVFPDLMAGARGFIDGSIVPEMTEFRIFKGEFIHYGSAHIFTDPKYNQSK